MRRLALIGAVFLMGAAPLPPPGATNCSGCHAAGGSAVPIDGRSADDLATTMLAYRDGERPSTLMGRLTKGLTPDQIRAIATWISQQ